MIDNVIELSDLIELQNQIKRLCGFDIKFSIALPGDGDINIIGDNWSREIRRGTRRPQIKFEFTVDSIVWTPEDLKELEQVEVTSTCSPPFKDSTSLESFVFCKKIRRA